MKNFKGFIIIGISIIIGAIIIAIPIYNKSISSLDHCYEKVYKRELRDGEAEAEAAIIARRYCRAR